MQKLYALIYPTISEFLAPRRKIFEATEMNVSESFSLTGKASIQNQDHMVMALGKGKKSDEPKIRMLGSDPMNSCLDSSFLDDSPKDQVEILATQLKDGVDGSKQATELATQLLTDI
jgi:hypothetical protein